MGSARVLALVAVLALGGAGWLALHGTGELRGIGGGVGGELARTEPSTSGATALAASPESDDELALAPPTAPSAATAREAVVAPAEARRPRSMATLALRLVSRETHRPLAGVHARIGGPRRSDLLKTADGAARFLEAGADPFGAVEDDVQFIAESHGTEQRSPRSDADGRLEIEVRAGTSLTLRINPSDLAHVRPESYEVPELEPGERRESEIALVTEDDLRWCGRVLDDATGEPLGGVRATWLRGPLERAEPAPVASAADGVLVLNFASWQKARVRLELAGYLAARLELERGYESPDRACAVRLVHPAELEVRVRDGRGAPLAGLQVELVQLEAARDDPLRKGEGTVTIVSGNVTFESTDSPVGPKTIGVATTDADGTCTFRELPPRESLSAALRAGLGRTQRENLTLQPGETRTLTFTVGDGCRIEGLCVDEHGEPLAGVDLWRLPVGDPPPLIESARESTVVDKARTDARGRFAFANVPAGDWWLAPAPYHRNRGIVPLATSVSIPAGERVHALTLTCSLGHSIEGRVRDAAGQPAAHASVRAEQGEARQFVESGADGRFRIGPVASGEWLLTASSVESSDGRSASVRAQADDVDVELRLRPGGRLSGRVLDERGKGASMADVQLVDETGFVDSRITASRGDFDFGGSLPGRYLVLARSGATVGALAPVTLAAGQRVEALELRLAPGTELRLRFAPGTPDGLAARVAWNGSGVATFPARGEPSVVLPPGSVVVQLVQLVRAGETERTVLEEQRAELARGETRVLVLGSSGAAATKPR